MWLVQGTECLKNLPSRLKNTQTLLTEILTIRASPRTDANQNSLWWFWCECAQYLEPSKHIKLFKDQIFSSFPPSLPSFLRQIFSSGWPQTHYESGITLNSWSSCFSLPCAGMTICTTMPGSVYAVGLTPGFVHVRQALHDWSTVHQRREWIFNLEDRRLENYLKPSEMLGSSNRISPSPPPTESM